MNETPCGTALFTPYMFDVKDKFVKGENTIVVEVITNLAYRERDRASYYHSLPVMGMMGPVKLEF